MSKFVVAATVDDPDLLKDATFSYRITDNDNYVIDTDGGVTAKPGYEPQVGDRFTVEVSYTCIHGYTSKAYKTFTVKI
ncbi:MAG: hypothetical protein KBT03_08960 [Bacteroidales bacterium]|nr:hypothetical protein [Candidatus Scybalousia scybalohippi]